MFEYEKTSRYNNKISYGYWFKKEREQFLLLKKDKKKLYNSSIIPQKFGYNIHHRI